MWLEDILAFYEKEHTPFYSATEPNIRLDNIAHNLIQLAKWCVHNGIKY